MACVEMRGIFKVWHASMLQMYEGDKGFDLKLFKRNPKPESLNPYC